MCKDLRHGLEVRGVSLFGLECIGMDLWWHGLAEGFAFKSECIGAVIIDEDWVTVKSLFIWRWSSRCSCSDGQVTAHLAQEVHWDIAVGNADKRGTSGCTGHSSGGRKIARDQTEAQGRHRQLTWSSHIFRNFRT